MAKKLSKSKIDKLLQEGLKQYGVTIYPKLIPKIAAHIVDNYNKVTLTGQEKTDHDIFTLCLNQVRLASNNFSNIKDIRKGTSQYTTVTKLLPTLNRFTDLYAKDNRHLGYTEYIKIALKLMAKKYSINKFGYYEDIIFQLRDYQRQIQHDPNPDNTRRMQKAWDICLQKEYGVVRNKPIQEDEYSDFINFLWAREQADELNADYMDWCMSQIEALRFIGEPPMLSTLSGDKALKRYNEYKVVIKKPTKNASKLDKIKQYLNDNQTKKQS